MDLFLQKPKKPMGKLSLTQLKSRLGGARHIKGVVRVGGAVDGRHKRAMIVKNIMKEQGLSMIKASSYVKQHKLY